MTQNKVTIFYMSLAHNPELNDYPLQKYLKKNNFEVRDFCVNGNRNFLSKVIFVTNLIASTIMGLLNYKRYFFFMSSVKNVSLIKKIIYLMQFFYVSKAANSLEKKKIIFLFRGNNLPNISLLKKEFKNSKIVILPHGLYFQDPPENKFFLDADLIITGNAIWPGSNFNGQIERYGMIENRLLKKTNKKKSIKKISIVTTHSSEKEANYINQIAEILSDKDYVVDIRVHPRNKELISKLSQKFFSVAKNKLPIHEYLSYFDACFFTRGYNNRISNILYEAALVDFPVYIIDDQEANIVNLPFELRDDCMPIKKLVNDQLNIYTGFKLKNKVNEFIFQEEKIFQLISNSLQRLIV